MNPSDLLTKVLELADGYGATMPDRMAGVFVKHLKSYSADTIQLAFRRVQSERADKLPTAYQLVKWCEAAQHDLETRANCRPVVEPEPEVDEVECSPEEVKRAIAALKEAMRVG